MHGAASVVRAASQHVNIQMIGGTLLHQNMTMSEQNVLEYKAARQERTAAGSSSPRIHRSEKRGMTDIYVELGGKKAIAWSLEWPGWCRIRTSEEAAVQALIDTEARYRLIAQRAGQNFAPGNLVVVERLLGDGNTAWGVPSVLASAENRPIDATTAQRNVVLLRASWDMLEEVVAASPAELRKGPRGGGRDRDEIQRHVIEAERVYARKIGVRHKPFEMNDKSALEAMREEMAAVLSKPSNGELLVSGGWNASYAVRRIAWHVVDHIWEIEDRRL